MANDFLISKWRKWFSLFVYNNDGRVCYADMERARSKFLTLHHMEGEQKEAAGDSFTKWWCEYVMWGTQEITEDEFVEKQNAAFKADKAKFLERNRKCQDHIGSFLNVAQDGFISEEELTIMFKAEGHEDEAIGKRFFAKFSPVDGKVPKEKLLEDWYQFLTSEDSALPDPVQKGFEGGL